MDKQLEKHFSEAVAAQQAQQLDRASELYQKVLEIEPNHPGALCNLGRVARVKNDNATALELYQRAAEAPGAPPEVFYNLGNIQFDLDQLQEAKSSYTHAISMADKFAAAYTKLSFVEEKLGHVAEAAQMTKEAAEYIISDASLYFRAAVLFENLRQVDEAIQLYRKTLAIRPELEEATTRLAHLLFRQAEGDEAVALLQGLLARNPQDLATMQNLNFIYKSTGHYNKALRMSQMAHQISPETASYQVDMATALINLGRASEGRALLNDLLKDSQGSSPGGSSYLMSLLYAPEVKPEFIHAEHVRLTANWPAHARKKRGFFQKRSSPLRVGYLTADFFGNHPVAQFIAPVIKAYDDPAFGVRSIVYNTSLWFDATAMEMASLCEMRDLSSLDDEAAVALIKKDELDILIDLSGHTSGRRLPLLGLRPAPAQACFIGYPSTTGFSAVDYLIADDKTIPLEHEALYSEEIIRLPDSFLCFQPPTSMPIPNKKQNDELVFGSLNHFPKINDELLDVWAEILKQLPNARFMMQCGVFAEEESIDAFKERMQAKGIESARLDLFAPQPFAEAMSRYNEIDIALDTFPYNGGTTTCHALWMGTPVITLAGDYFCGRMGLSLLTAAQRTEWIAETKAEYIEKAVALASDSEGLRAAQSKLVAELKETPLCDINRYAKALVDSVFKKM